MKYLITIVHFMFLIFSPWTFCDDAVPSTPLLVGAQILKTEKKILLAINYKNYPEWHTYWKNPGDAGLAIENRFLLNKKEIAFTPLEWPAPKKFIENGNQWAYGYTDEYSLFYEIDSKYLDKVIDFDSKWLICKNICVPGKKSFSMIIKNNSVEIKDTNILPPREEGELLKRFQSLPQMAGQASQIQFTLTKSAKEKELLLTYTLKNAKGLLDKFSNANLLYALPHKPFDFTHEHLEVVGNDIEATLPISWDGEYQTPPEALNPNGQFSKPHLLKFLFNDPIHQKFIIIEKVFKNFDTNPVLKKKIVILKSTSSLSYYLILAFIGGLILNIMPCVLPVISIKLFGLIKHQKESKKRILRHNLFYTLGVLITFFILALIVVLLKSVGTTVGWGFQLQSPIFISLMIIVLFVFAINLFGVFEFHTPGGSILPGLKLNENFIGDMLGGVLATILSTPCSAPFLGTALTFAFTSPAWTIFSIFLMIGLGLSFPFIITGLFPSLVFFLPRPGKWMNNVKKLLGGTLILTCIWLLDVYTTLVHGGPHLTKLFILLLFIFVAITLRKKGKKIAVVLGISSFILFLNMINSPINMPAEVIENKHSDLNYEIWSEEKMNEYQQKGELVFIDFTAKWCFTCKINEKLVLDTDSFKELAKKNHLKLLIGDWTKRDEVIGKFLLKNNLVGVPAYFIQKKDGTLISLGETISISKIEQNLH